MRNNLNTGCFRASNDQVTFNNMEIKIIEGEKLFACTRITKAVQQKYAVIW